MSPREQYEVELFDNVGIRDIEVVFHGRDIDVAIKLCPN